MLTEINKAIEEFTPLYDDVTTSDLQGICEARAMQIIGNSKNLQRIMEISDKILEGIYERVESC